MGCDRHVAALTLGLLLAACSGSGSDAPPLTPEGLVDQSITMLPDESTKVLELISPASGPDSALLGLLLDNDTRAYVLDQVENGDSVVNAVAIADADGHLVLKQESGPAWTRLTLVNGDSLTFFTEDGVRLTLTSNATDPPSEVVINISASGEATVDASATSIATAENAAYSGGTARVRIAQPLARRASALGQLRSALTRAERCAGVGNKVITAIDYACKAKSLVSAKKVGEAGLNAACIAAGEATAAIDGKVPARLLSALRTSLDLSCEYAKKGLGYGSLLTKINPIDAACFTLSRAKDLASDQLAESVCNLLSTGDDVERWLLCEKRVGETTHLGCFRYSEDDGDRDDFCVSKGYEAKQDEYNDSRDDPAGEYAEKPLEKCADICSTPSTLDGPPEVCDTHSQPFEIWIMCLAPWEGQGYGAVRTKCFKYTGPGFPYSDAFFPDDEGRVRARAQCESLDYQNDSDIYDSRSKSIEDAKAECIRLCKVKARTSHFPQKCEH